MIQVTDVHGYTITVTDLDAAMRQAEEYRRYHHTDRSYRHFDRQQQAYWNDMYKKLSEIKLKEST